MLSLTIQLLEKKTKDGDLEVVTDKFGQVKLRHGDKEVRLEQDPFPLCPGEKLSGSIQPLRVIEENTALRLKSLREFEDKFAVEGKPIRRKAGDEWLFKGPGTYIPQVEVEVVETVKAIILKPDQALKVKARDSCTDYKGAKRKAGEEWIVKLEGAYLPGVYETVVETLNAVVLTPKNALHLRAIRTFVDQHAGGVERKAGEEWLVTMDQSEVYIPGVDEVITKQVTITVLSKRQWCIIANPVGDDGRPLLGTRKLVKGERSFFLKPGEVFEGAIRDVIVLGPDEALWVKAREAFEDKSGPRSAKRRPGNKWLVYGPGEYWPPLEVDVGAVQRAFLKIEALGIYYFQPVLFFLVVFAIMFALYMLNKYWASITGNVNTEL